MRSARKLLLVAIVSAPSYAVAQPDVPFDNAPPTRADVQQALAEVKNDPNLAAERTVNMLRWVEAAPVTDEPWWQRWLTGLVRWFRGLFGWLAESGRYVVWLLGTLLAVLLVVAVARMVRKRGVPRVRKTFVTPSHVRDLDIRPESLPGDIGAAALALWQSGEQRAALALLYRGSLSRLVHVHGVPIRASSTEGECVELARPRLGDENARYVARLVDTWAAAVYGGATPPAGVVAGLCADFSGALDGAAGAA